MDREKDKMRMRKGEKLLSRGNVWVGPAAPIDAKVKCKVCDGTGKIKIHDSFNRIDLEAPCPVCQ